MKNNFFLKTITHRVITWQGKVIILASVLLMVFLCWPLLRVGVTNYISHDDELHPVSRIIVENWDGQIDIFSGAAKVASTVGATEIFSIIFEDTYYDARKRKAYFLNAWAAGIDTVRFFLIPVPKREPKTMNIARTVLETAHQRQWTELTIATFALHSSRTKKAYLIAAKPYDISIRVAGIPVEDVTSQNWSTTASGLAMAFSETIKKIYYDVVVF